jgi:hypothetical protein
MGGVPELRQILELGHSLSQPAHPHVFLLLYVANSPSSMPFAASIMLHESLVLTVYVAHDPSALFFGLLSLSLPEEQQIHWLTLRPEQKLEAGLYLVRRLGVMPHFS